MPCRPQGSGVTVGPGAPIWRLLDTKSGFSSFALLGARQALFTLAWSLESPAMVVRSWHAMTSVMAGLIGHEAAGD